MTKRIAGQLYLSARSPGGDTIADALDSIPAIDTKLNSIGWKRPLAEMIGDAEFVNDICAYGFAGSEEAAKDAIKHLASLLDRHADAVTTDRISLQAWHISEAMDRPVRGATLQWSRQAALHLGSPKVFPMRPRWASA